MKTSEMIAMLEQNPKLKFKSQTGYIASVNEFTGLFRWQHPQGTTGISNNLRLLSIPGDIADDWTPCREPVPVWEAIKALLSEGKTVTCEYQPSVAFKKEIYRFNKNDMHIQHIFSTILLSAGVWYIEDE